MLQKKREVGSLLNPQKMNKKSSKKSKRKKKNLNKKINYLHGKSFTRMYVSPKDGIKI